MQFYRQLCKKENKPKDQTNLSKEKQLKALNPLGKIFLKKIDPSHSKFKKQLKRRKINKNHRVKMATLNNQH